VIRASADFLINERLSRPDQWKILKKIRGETAKSQSFPPLFLLQKGEWDSIRLHPLGSDRFSGLGQSVLTRFEAHLYTSNFSLLDSFADAIGHYLWRAK